MLTQGKVWGETTEIFKNMNTEVHYLEINKNGFCSEHKHSHKYNIFFIIEGQLRIKIWRKKNEEPDVTVIGEMGWSAVPPGTWHQFEATENTKCLEIYQVFLEGDDIMRRKVGGIRK